MLLVRQWDRCARTLPQVLDVAQGWHNSRAHQFHGDLAALAVSAGERHSALRVLT
jgi:hypothetical protein